MMTPFSPTYRGYGAGHPWYYLLDGSVLTPKQICKSVQASGYRGYRADEIKAADDKAEPDRSAILRRIRADVTDELRRDLSGYRRAARQLLRHRKDNPVLDRPSFCTDVHVAISLKHNHLYKDFAHLMTIDNLLRRQGDLFGS